MPSQRIYYISININKLQRNNEVSSKSQPVNEKRRQKNILIQNDTCNHKHHIKAVYTAWSQPPKTALEALHMKI